MVELSEDELADLTEGNVTASEMAIYIPNDGQINANHYTKALFKSLQQRRISRYFNTNVTDIIRQNGYYQIVSSQGDLYAKKVIVASGAWSSQLLKQYQLPRVVVGVKGEVLLMEHDHLNLKQTVFMTNGCYIVPKAPNRYLIGATSEFDNYSVGNTEQGVSWLEHYATERILNLQTHISLNSGLAYVHIRTANYQLWTGLTMVYMSLPAIIGTVFYCPLLLVVTSQTGY